MIDPALQLELFAAAVFARALWFLLVYALGMFGLVGVLAWRDHRARRREDANPTPNRIASL